MRRVKIFLSLVMFSQVLSLCAAASVEGNYLSRLQSLIIETRARLPDLSKSAEGAAKEFVSGANIWAAGAQSDFISEACGRAGGLMSIAPLESRTPSNHDIVLYATPGGHGEDEMKMMNHWKAQGAMPVTFDSRAGLLENKAPLDTVCNVIELWTWTGEFVSACTRLGKMPVLYQSYGLPGGRERARKYEGKRFHDDLQIAPIAEGTLGSQYLDQIARMLESVNNTQFSHIRRAAGWWKDAPTCVTLVTGHMFPRHAEDSRAPRLCDFAPVSAWEDKELLTRENPPRFVFYLGYQFAPTKLLDQARLSNINLVYTCVQPADTVSTNIIYINPAWPLSDGCVPVPGYDIQILPASGVVQAAIYWTMVLEREALK